MLLVSSSVSRVIHVCIFIVFVASFNLFVILKANEILQLWELILMSRYKIIDIVECILRNSGA